jgi:hypothetical protein
MAVGGSTEAAIGQIDNQAEYDQFVPTYDYITWRDYGRPLLGAVRIGLAMAIVVSALSFIIGGPFLAIIIFILSACLYTVQFPLAFLLSAFIHHHLYLHRLRKHGPAWYLKQQVLDLPMAEAFELCLAACAQFEKGKISEYDDQKGYIRLSIKGNFLVTVDRNIGIILKENGPGSTILRIDSQLKLTSLRSRLIKMCWGEKWHPIVFRTDRNLNNKLMTTIISFVDSVPNWDHRHVSMQEQWENLDKCATTEKIFDEQADQAA